MDFFNLVCNGLASPVEALKECYDLSDEDAKSFITQINEKWALLNEDCPFTTKVTLIEDWNKIDEASKELERDYLEFLIMGAESRL